MTSKAKRFFEQPIVTCLLLGVFIGVLYVSSLDHQFTNWDDGMIYNNWTIRDLGWKGIKALFRYEKASTYQPIRMLSYAIDYRFWKLDPMGYRITNIIFYILTTVMVFFTLRQLSSHLREPLSPDSHHRTALFGSFLFAAHPVHVEAVTWLSARKETLQGFFFFLAFFLYLRGREGEGRKRLLFLSLSLITILLATLSKPSAVVFPGVLLVYEIAKNRGGWFSFFKRHWVFFAVSILISAVFVFILMKVMFDAGGVKPYRGGTFLNNLLISFYVFLYNIKLLTFTINYSAAYTIEVTNPLLSLQTFVMFGTTLLLFGLSLWSLKWEQTLFFSFFFFVLTLLPYLNIIPISTILADRYLFIASFSYAFLLGMGFDRLFRARDRRFSEGFFKLVSIALFLFLLVSYGLMTLRQNKIWENSYTLWADAVEKYPESNTANALMGAVYMDLGMDEEARRYLEKAIQILPYDYHSRNNLGIVYGRMDQPEKALNELLIALRLRPDDDFIRINLAVFFQKQKEYPKAEEILKSLLSRDPRNANLYFRLGLVYKEMGRYEPAISSLKKAMEISPQVINPYEEIGNIYLSRLGDREKAILYYQKGIEAVPKARARVEELRWMIQDLEHHR